MSYYIRQSWEYCDVNFRIIIVPTRFLGGSSPAFGRYRGLNGPESDPQSLSVFHAVWSLLALLGFSLCSSLLIEKAADIHSRRECNTLHRRLNFWCVSIVDGPRPATVRVYHCSTVQLKRTKLTQKSFLQASMSKRYYVSSTGNYSRLYVCFVFSRSSGFCFLQLIIPSTAVVITSWVSLWMESETEFQVPK